MFTLFTLIKPSNVLKFGENYNHKLALGLHIAILAYISSDQRSLEMTLAREAYWLLLRFYLHARP